MKNKIILILRLVAAIILLQTLFFKFTAAPESVFIFNTLGIEPWGRWLSGVSELIASILLLLPVTHVLGALMGLGIMAGAIVSHISFLGLVVQQDGGLLFSLAMTVFISCFLILFFRQKELWQWLEKFKLLIKIK